MNESTATPSRGLRSRDTGRSSYLQIGELVEHVQHQHRRLRRAYRAREATPSATRSAERIDLVLAYLAKREEAVDALLERLSRNERKSLLETWIQNLDLSRYDRKVDELIDELPEDPQRVRAEVSRLDRELVDLYRGLAGQVTAPTARRFFQDLRERVEERAREHSEFLQQVEDL